jgi:hypothetical protein
VLFLVVGIIGLTISQIIEHTTSSKGLQGAMYFVGFAFLLLTIRGVSAFFPSRRRRP